METEALVRQACKKFENDKGRMMDVLWELQNALGCIDDHSMEIVARELKTSRVAVEGVVTFYSFFSREQKGKIILRVCDDIIDRHAGSEKIASAFSEELGVPIGGTSSDKTFSLEYTPCIGMSDQAPSALINGVPITNLTPESARDTAKELIKGVCPSSLVKKTGDGNNSHELIKSMVNNNIQKRGEVLLSTDVSKSAGLDAALKLSSPDVIKEIIDSGLRGRGGAGFPTGEKFRLARNTNSDKRYVICNADEGEPGTFKDRVLLTERADLLFDGMTIAAHAIGSNAGIVYLRGEYAYLLPYLESVLAERRSAGLLGKSIRRKKDFDFDIRIQLGAGAYICGEESALISSLEGLRGEPKNRPPFPVEKGYMGKPTVVNNVETFCCVARIMENGAAWFSAIGTKASKGTKLLSICGDCTKPGVYEVPYGLTVSELLVMVGAHDTTIVQVGGAGGVMVGKSSFGRKICVSDLATGGAIMVFGANRNVLGIVDYFLEFFSEESCGYCTPCRVGVIFLRERIKKVMQGLADKADLGYLRDLSKTIKMTSRCGLGSSAPNCVINSIDEFPLVYSSHMREKSDGFAAGFDIQKALDESRRIAKRTSMIYDPVYGEERGLGE